MEYGVGPLLVVPWGGDETGSGKWQAGAAGLLVAPQRWGLVGAIGTYQHSFAGDDDRSDVELITAQPLIIYNLPDGFYLRSSATWTFDLKSDADFIPVGFGAGKVFRAGKTTINLFVEPQITAWKNGPGTPLWQIYMGLNLQFPAN